MTELVDAYGRKVDYLRISLTDRCNLRCRYCMPKEGIGGIGHERILTLEEILRVARILTEMGVRRIRITGGEPLVRRNVLYLIRQLGALPGQPELTLTTNGVLLEEVLPEILAAGLHSINISLDTLDREVYRELTGTDALERVLRGMEKALEMGMQVKLNTVPIRGINEKELTVLAGLARDRGIAVRFIELMPIGCAKDLRGIPGEEILHILEDEYGSAEPEGGTPGVSELQKEARGPARYYHFRGFRGNVGFIDPLSHSFCSSCNRVRLTSDGRLKLCLYYPEGPDLRKMLRGGCSDEELKQAITRELIYKPECHSFINPSEGKDSRNMNEIGG